ncbi:MAG: PIN domain-containing protein [Thaumarchaeota archaeon]|nr:PIN domain-containing protein [Nitrososphaerota archaeon]
MAEVLLTVFTGSSSKRLSTKRIGTCSGRVRTPLLDTVVLFAAADSLDPLHESAVHHMRKLGGAYLIGTFALLEFDVVLKSNGFSNEKRIEEFALLLRDYPAAAEATHGVSPSALYLAILCEREFDLSYFDALIAAEAIDHDGKIVSNDRAFDRIPGLSRISLS